VEVALVVSFCVIEACKGLVVGVELCLKSACGGDVHVRVYGGGVDLDLVSIPKVAGGGSWLCGFPDPLLLEGGKVGGVFVSSFFFSSLGPDIFPVEAIGGFHMVELFLSGSPLDSQNWVLRGDTVLEEVG